MGEYDGGLSKLSPSARTALEYAANVIQQDHWLTSGETSLFWHLVGTASSHIAGQKETSEGQEERHLTAEEQDVMADALRRSGKVVAVAKLPDDTP